MKTFSWLIVILALLCVPAGFADTGVSAELQVALFYKIFDFDESLFDLKGPSIIVGIIYDAADPESREAGKQIAQAFSQVSDRTIAGKQAVIKEITAADALPDGINILYVAPGNDSRIAEIVKCCQKSKIFGISGLEQYARDGLPVAIGVENNKPKIIVNQAQSALCGVKLSSKLLALAKIL